MLSSSGYMLIQHFSRRMLPAVARQQRVLLAAIPRSFASVASSAKPVNTTVDQQQHEFIKAAISKLLEQAEPKESAKMVSDEALKKAATYFQNQLEEASLCVRDVREAAANSPERAEEYSTAETALDEAVASFVDLVDALRQSTAEQQEHWKSLRERASVLKELRHELSALAPPETK